MTIPDLRQSDQIQETRPVVLVRDTAEMQHIADSLRASGKRIAVVPTMGYLHEGHLSLIRIARHHVDVVVTTIFVNPTQFGQGEDYERYPRDIERDTALASAAGTDYLFVPETPGMYPPGYETFVDVDGLSSILEGKSRPGHFRGVATIVAKLFLITRPHVAVFGQKDAQQVAVIRRMVRDLNFGVEIVVGPTVREKDGLAMSSRNVYLTPAQRAEAAVLFQSLHLAQQRIDGGTKECSLIRDTMRGFIQSQSHGIVDYISIADAESLQELQTIAPGQTVLVSLAIVLGTTRLIDNCIMTVK
jgi:pantoate--beta-alanine ligase